MSPSAFIGCKQVITKSPDHAANIIHCQVSVVLELSHGHAHSTTATVMNTQIQKADPEPESSAHEHDAEKQETDGAEEDTHVPAFKI